MLALDAFKLASYCCAEVAFFFRLRVVSKEWHHTFEFPPEEVILRRVEQVYAGYFVQFSLPTSHGIA